MHNQVRTITRLDDITSVNLRNLSAPQTRLSGETAHKPGPLIIDRAKLRPHLIRRRPRRCRRRFHVRQFRSDITLHQSRRCRPAVEAGERVPQSPAVFL